MLRLGWIKHPGAGGYQRVGDELEKALKRNGATITDYADWVWDACVHISPPRAAYVGPHHRPDVVIHTMIEFDQTPPGWVALLNRVGMVWVPSSYAERVFREGGVTTPIFKTPYGISPTWEYRPRTADGPFRVLAWGDTLASRKNIRTIIDAFIAAGIPDAVLEVKLANPLMPNRMHWEDRDDIIIHNGNWKDWELLEWMHTGHVGVYVSSGEGYGLMPKEMMATGLPMIAMISTGMTEYLRSDMILEVESQRRPSSYWRRIFSINVDEPFPVMGSLVEQLRYASQHPGVLADLGRRGSEYAHTYTWDAAGKLAIQHLADHYGVAV